MFFRPTRAQDPRTQFSNRRTMTRMLRLPGRLYLTLLLCFAMATAPVPASAGPGATVKALAAACVLYLAQIGGAEEPPKKVDPPEARKVEDVKKEVDRVRDGDVQRERDNVRNGTAANEKGGNGVGREVIEKNFGSEYLWKLEAYLVMGAMGLLTGGGFVFLWGRIRGYRATTDAVMKRRADILTEEKTAYDAAKGELDAAELVMYQAVERAVVNNEGARAGMRERVQANLMKGPAKDKLLDLLKEPPRRRPEDAPAVASVPEGPTVEEAFTAYLAKYEALKKVYDAVRKRLIDNGVKPEKLPELPEVEKVLEGLSADLRALLGLDQLKLNTKNAVDAVKDIDEATRQWLAGDPTNSTGGRALQWLGVGAAVPAVGLSFMFAPQFWPLYFAGGATLWAVYRASAVTRWKFALLTAIVAVSTTSGLLTNLYLKSADVKVEKAETDKAQRAIEARPLAETGTDRLHDQEWLAQAFDFGFTQVPKFKDVESPVKPSGDPKNPNPDSDFIQKEFDKAMKEIEGIYGREGARKHMLELYELVARAFSNRSAEFKELEPEEQERIVKFIAKQMEALRFQSVAPRSR